MVCGQRASHLPPVHAPGFRLLRVSLLAAALSLAACDRVAVSAPEPLAAGDIRGYVTSDVASHLAADGTFQLPAPPDSLRISPEEAKELALVFARRFGPSLRVTLERQHGRGIDLENLRVGSPVYYAETSYAPLPPNVHPGYHNAYGPCYLVYLVSPDGTPTLVVAVATHSGAWVEDGRIRFPLHYGNDFYAEGVRLGEGFYKPLSPEQAVRRVSEATGARAAAVPDLWRAEDGYASIYSRWRVRLDRPVTTRSLDSREVRQVREVYVGRRGEFFVPSPAQPAELFTPDPLTTGGMIRIGVLPGRPAAFEAVTLSKT